LLKLEILIFVEHNREHVPILSFVVQLNEKLMRNLELNVQALGIRIKQTVNNKIVCNFSRYLRPLSKF